MFFKVSIVIVGFSELKTKLPATKTSAPAFTNSLPVTKFTPPSTSINAFDFFKIINSLT